MLKAKVDDDLIKWARKNYQTNSLMLTGRRYRVKRVGRVISVTDRYSKLSRQRTMNSVQRAMEYEADLRQLTDKEMHELRVDGHYPWKELDNEILGLKKIF